MSIISDYLASTAKVALNAQRFDQFINGGAEDLVSIDEGAIRTLRGVQKYGNRPTVTVGTVETGEPDTEVIVTYTPTDTGIELNFKIPRGSGGAGGGTPTANAVMPIGLYMAAGSAAVPTNVYVVQTAGYSAQGIGSAFYAYSSEVNAAYVGNYPGTAFMVGSRGFRIIDPELTPAKFGEIGAGTGNSTIGLRNMCREIVRRGGGTIVMDKTVYIVGDQSSFPNGVGIGDAPMNLEGCTGRVTIRGNGAILRGFSGGKYGSFDPATGQKRNSLSTNLADRASPMECGLRWVNCSGNLSVTGLRVEGQSTTCNIGGEWSGVANDTGRQIPHGGFHILNATGRIELVDCDAVEMGQDGAIVSLPTSAGVASPRNPLTFRRCFFLRNGRQGVSQIGGRGARYVDCRFSDTGRAVNNGTGAPLYSAPGAGFDMEAEGGNINRDTVFDNCEFVNNAGQGFVADTGDSGHAEFRKCRFIGTTNWSVWPNKPGMTFDNCTFIGAIVNCYPDGSLVDNARFSKCLFTDDTSLSPTGTVYGGRVADFGGSAAIPLFDACVFRLTGGMTLPYHAGGARYNNCILSQVTSTPTVLSGTYTGAVYITAPNGATNLINSTFAGVLFVNGVKAGGPQAVEQVVLPNIFGGPLAAGASSVFQIRGFNGFQAVLAGLHLQGNGNGGDPTRFRITNYLMLNDGLDLTIINESTVGQLVQLNFVRFGG